VAGLETAQKLFTEASAAAKDGNEADSWTPFCAGEIGMVSAPGWIKGLIEDPKTGCPDTYGKEIGVFALPGTDGEPAPVLLGGSDIAIAAKSANQALAQKAVTLMLSEDYQTIMAEAGLTPALTSLAPLLGDDEFAAATIAAASNAKLTPAAPGWATVEGSRVLEDLFVAIAQGGDVAELAAKADEQMDEQING
jgi:N,N'-diacetylchitobiose transport system substrate-binding protein